MERTRIHPMMAVAAASVTLASLVGAASIAGVLPDSKANTPAPVVATAAPVDTPMVAPEPRRVVEHRTVVHHAAAPQPQVVQTQAPAPAPQNSVVGIGLGAVVGGLLGNQVGSGNGRKLATIAGAVGGGYVGNEIAKRNQQ